MNLTRDLIFLVLLSYWGILHRLLAKTEKGSFLVLLQQYVDICGNLDLFCRVGNFLFDLLFFDSLSVFQYLCLFLFFRKAKAAEWSFIQCFPH